MDCTVIIPSTCESKRHEAIKRAVESVLNQENRTTQILIVANGSRVDAGVIDMLRGYERLRIEFLEEGNHARAQRLGRQRMDTPFFGFLDDDDEYLPNALDVRMGELERDSGVDVVATSGLYHLQGEDTPADLPGQEIRRDPLRALLKYNWLASCAGLFRASSVSDAYFDGATRYFEWTWLAFRLASSLRVQFVDIPTFRIHDTPGSLSKSTAYQTGLVEVLEKIARLDLPDDVVRGVRRKIGDAHHTLSSSFLARAEVRPALHHHLISLRFPGGSRYLPYTRKFIPLFFTGHRGADRCS